MHMRKHFGVPLEGLELKIESRGAPPLGGGEVILGVPIIQNNLSVSYSYSFTKFVSFLNFASTYRSSYVFRCKLLLGLMKEWLNLSEELHSPLGPLLNLKTEAGYGTSLVAETTTGCLISADISVCATQENATQGLEESEEKTDLMPYEDLGIKAASMLLEEIEQGGVVDSTHQGLLFLLCALCPQDVSKVRVGKLTPYAIDTLRHIRDFLGVKFVIQPEPTTNTVILKCVGCGLKNLSRKVS